MDRTAGVSHPRLWMQEVSIRLMGGDAIGRRRYELRTSVILASVVLRSHESSSLHRHLYPPCPYLMLHVLVDMQDRRSKINSLTKA